MNIIKDPMLGIGKGSYLLHFYDVKRNRFYIRKTLGKGKNAPMKGI